VGVTAGDSTENDPDSTPDWAGGFPLWGELSRVQEGSTDLQRESFREWPFNLAAVGRRQNIFLLDLPISGSVANAIRMVEFSADGEQLDTWKLPPGTSGISFPRALAVSPDRRTFALLDKGQLILFNKDKQIRAVSFPHMPVDVAYNKGDLVVSNVPPGVSAVSDDAPDEERYLVIDVDNRGRIVSGKLEPEPVDAPRPHLAAFVQRLWIADEPETNRLWAADVMRYRLRRLSASGRVLTTIEDPSLDADLGFDVTEDETPTDLVRHTHQTTVTLRGRPVIWDLQVFDDLLYVLVSAEAISGPPVLDIYDLTGDPLARLKIPWSHYPNAMLVTDETVWFFRSFSGERPIRVVRTPAGEMVSAAVDARAHGDQPVRFETAASHLQESDER
jgi:hypothetical protein